MGLRCVGALVPRRRLHRWPVHEERRRSEVPEVHQLASAMVAQAIDRQNKVVALAAASMDEELRTIAADVVAMANAR